MTDGRAGNRAIPSRSSLMVTLGITKELVTECHRDINYFASSAASIVATALQAASKGSAQGARDVDITARAAATFYALANYLNMSSASMDADAVRQYLTLLGQFGKIANERVNDADTQNRIRQIGVGALAGAIGSDVFLTSSHREQLSHVIPALFANFDAKALSEAPELREEATRIAEKGSASNADYVAKRKPLNSRTVPSFSTDPEKAPTTLDIASAAMGSIRTALNSGDASHIQGLVAALLDFCNGKTGSGRQWANREWCCWVADALVSWTALPYRFVIPTVLVDDLIDDSDAPSDDRHFALVLMITTLLSGQYSMIGLSTSDTANDLLAYAVRRVHYDSKDPVLVPLVRCIGALGTHVYYADQLNDLAEEITARIATLEMPQSSQGGAGDPVAYINSKPVRESIRMLLACMLKLMDTAQRSSGEVQKGVARKGSDAPAEVQQAGARNRISPSVWHQTTSLLASPDYSVRQSLEEALLAFFATEVEPASLDAGHPVADTLGSKLSVEGTGFTHSLSAAMYVLALSKELHAPTSMLESPLEALPVIDRADKESQDEARNSTSSSLPTDFSALIQILDSMYERIPVASILGTVPALLALDKASASSLSGPRKDATGTLVQSALNKIGEVCGVSSIQSKVSTSLPHFPPPANAQPEGFRSAGQRSSSSSKTAVNASSVISSLANSSKLQAATDLDAKALHQWFGRDWSVQIAVDDSFIGASPYKLPDDDAGQGQNGNTSSQRSMAPGSNLSAKAALTDPKRVNGKSRTNVDGFRQALSNGVSSSDGAQTSSADKRASRRASRKISQPVKGLSDADGLAKGGANGPTSVGGLLDSMRVGLPEGDETNGVAKAGVTPSRSVAAPYVP